MSKRKPVVDGVELAEVVCKALAAAEAPLTVAKIRRMLSGPYHVDANRLLEVLRELVAAGKLHEFPPTGRSSHPQFWDRNHDEYARTIIAETIGAQPTTIAAMTTKVSKKLKGFRAERIPTLLCEMVEANKAIKHPPLPGVKTPRYGSRPPEPKVYLKKVVEQLDKVCAALSGAGLPKEQVVAALMDLLGAPTVPSHAEPAAPGSSEAVIVRSVGAGDETPASGEVKELRDPEPTAPLDEIGEKLVAEMYRLEPGAALGALVSLRDLRRRLPELDKPVFDRAVLALADRGRVTLHRHHYPAGEAPDVRAMFVQDDLGNHYVGVALRS